MPNELLSFAGWADLFSGTWQRTENIAVTEGRAAVMQARHRCRGDLPEPSIALGLLDNGRRRRLAAGWGRRPARRLRRPPVATAAPLVLVGGAVAGDDVAGVAAVTQAAAGDVCPASRLGPL